MRDRARDFTEMLADLDGLDIVSVAMRIAENEDLRDQFDLLAREVEAITAIEAGKGTP